MDTADRWCLIFKHKSAIVDAAEFVDSLMLHVDASTKEERCPAGRKENL